MKWSPDGRYLARLAQGIIQVYELPSMKLLDSKSIAAKDVIDFQWSPGSNMISYWSPASGNLPAIISIIQIPDRTIISSRKLFDVQDGKMIWHNEGNYLCMKISKVSGKKKSSILMLFRIRENEVPVELLELNENVLDVQWEPSKEKFAVAFGEPKSPTISFYTMGVPSTGATKNKKSELSLLYTLTGKQCNEMIWSPVGGTIAFAYIVSDTCIFELHDVDNNVSYAQRRHDRGTKLLWDPSGRTIASCTLTPLRQTAVKGQPDDGYNIYSFQGTIISQVRKEKLYQFLWRPRPKHILSSIEKQNVIKNLKKYEKIFDKEDKARKNQLESEAFTERKALADSFLALQHSKKSKILAAKKLRIALRDGYDSDDDNNFQVDIQVSSFYYY
jgi:translation initiation factor 3 subunit B